MISTKMIESMMYILFEYIIQQMTWETLRWQADLMFMGRIIRIHMETVFQVFQVMNGVNIIHLRIEHVVM